MRSMGDKAGEAQLEEHWKHPLTELTSQWARMISYVLALSHEATQLQQDIY
jgi:hypothetical protein